MSKSRYLGLTILFLAIAVFVSGSLVLTLRTSYAGDGRSPVLTTAIRLLQNA